MRAGLREALSADGKPEFDTVMKVIKAQGLKRHVQVAANAVPAGNWLQSTKWTPSNSLTTEVPG